MLGTVLGVMVKIILPLHLNRLRHNQLLVAGPYTQFETPLRPGCYESYDESGIWFK